MPRWQSAEAGASPFFPELRKSAAPAPAETPKIPLEVALGARDGGRMASANPMLGAAASLLILLGRLRLGIVEMHAVPLMEHVTREIEAFEAKALEAGEDPHDVAVAKYALCGTADDIVQNLPGTDRHVWLQFSMLARFFHVRTSGVGFFDELKKVLANPAARFDLLELMHACLSLGFEGQYRAGGAGGEGELQRVRQGVYEALRRVRPRADEDISPRWQGLALRMKPHGAHVPLFVVASLAGALLVGVFFFLRLLLSGESEALAGQMLALHPKTPITLERPAITAAYEPPPVDTSQLQRIREALAPEIAAGGVAVEPVGESITVRVDNALLFASGRADVGDTFAAVAEKVARALDPEKGPIVVTGHTDNVKMSGTGRYKSNVELSLARAKAVAAIVGKSLADPARLKVEGHGADEPIADNATAEGRARNRRVEIAIAREETL